jgi:autotransporter strand-loop-strand O-heptosyltransferase
MRLRRLLDRFSPISLNVHFNDGAFVQNLSKRRHLMACFYLDDQLVYRVTLQPGQWGRTTKRYLCRWRIEISDERGRVVAIHDFEPAGKAVRVTINSRSLGDTLAWLPQVAQFARQNPGTRVLCSHFWPQLGFADSYPEIEFIKPDDSPAGLYATYTLGLFFGDDALRSHPVDPRTIPLARIASDILAIEYAELRPRLPAPSQKPLVSGKSVCFAMESTAGCKLWHYPGGWQEIVDYLRDRGYTPLLIQKGQAELDGIVNLSGDLPIQQRIDTLHHCSFFVGLGSGLSWLAWALGRKVILISGFSEPFAEFQQGCYRVINENVCHGCWNRVDYQFDRGDWDWCPAHKGTDRQFECSRQITPAMVIRQIDRLIDEQKTG